MWTRVHYLPIALLFFSSTTALADYKNDIGYSRLLAELGAATPDGAGVPVTQVEAETGNPPVYMPNVDDAQFTGKNITDVTGINPLDSYSGHATGVGRNYFGNSSSIAPAIDTIKAYNAGYWLGGNYLRATQGRFKPAEIPDRVANHSWVGNDPDDAVDLDILKRVDWVVDQDEFIQAVGLTNGTSTNPPLLSAAFNVIAVGVTDGQHGKSTVSLDPTYVAGRTRPNLVTPFTTTSSATPIVAAAAALLVEQGNSMPSLSTDPVESSTTSRAGATVYNAGRSEVVKAVLMAGADRVTDNSTNPDPDTPKDITDYRVDAANQSANGLDKRYGAGQLNIYNSYHILAAGEQNSIEDNIGGGGSIGPYGFDYDPSFGGAGNAGGSNETGSYYFSTSASPVMLTAALGWNVHVAEGSRNAFPGAATLYDMDLRLYDETAGGHILVTASTSSIDNTENIWILLDAGKDYLLEVRPKAGQAAFEWDYALAWQLVDYAGQPDADGDGVADVADNCTDVANPGQEDADGDGHGNICDGDFNNDCLTDIFDLFAFKGAFGNPGADAQFDLDNSGGAVSVNTFDLFIFKGLFGQIPGPSPVGSFCNQ